LTTAFLAAGAAALLFAAATPALAQAAAEPVAAPRQADDPALATILTDYEAWLRSVDPISAGMEGDVEAKSRLPDASRAFELAQAPVLRGFADRLAAIDPTRLSDDDRLNHAFLGYVIRRALDRIPLDTGRIDAFSSEGGPGQTAGYLASVTRIASRADAEGWIARLEALPRF